LLSEQYSTIAGDFAEEVREAIFTHGLSHTKDYFMYEVDGFGSAYFMDDANHPSLLSMPLFGFVGVLDEIYQNTRQRVLSSHNPFYFAGSVGSGIGGPH
jgi:meiotically up-regulated gene 157 (Mug157) protein